ncbi:MAG: biotin transporter BioY [Planctomycetota bacterium]
MAGHPDLAARSNDAAQRATLRVVGALSFMLYTTVGAYVAIPIPPFGVPMTLQTLAVVLAAVCLGPKVGTASMALYLVAGMVGVPLYADGNAGLGVILGQTGGYLVGFVACQPVVAWLMRGPGGLPRGWGEFALAVVAAHAVIFLIGVPWLAIVRGIDLWTAAKGGMLPFLPGMVVKCAIAVLIGRLALPWCTRNIW